MEHIASLGIFFCSLLKCNNNVRIEENQLADENHSTWHAEYETFPTHLILNTFIKLGWNYKKKKWSSTFKICKIFSKFSNEFMAAIYLKQNDSHTSSRIFISHVITSSSCIFKQIKFSFSLKTFLSLLNKYELHEFRWNEEKKKIFQCLQTDYY